MKIYIYKWKDCFPSLICIDVLFQKWRKPYKYLNYLFLPQLPAYTNWFRTIFKNLEISFHDIKTIEKTIKHGIKRNWLELIKVI